MPKFINPLLADIRASKKLKPIYCTRVYTTVCKNGSFRVKFYNVDADNVRPMRGHICQLLRGFGWKQITTTILRSRMYTTILRNGRYPREIESLVIRASR